MSSRYIERVFIYNGIRKIVREYSYMIPEDFVANMTKAEAAAFKMNEAVTSKAFPQSAKDSIAYFNLEV